MPTCKASIFMVRAFYVIADKTKRFSLLPVLIVLLQRRAWQRPLGPVIELGPGGPLPVVPAPLWPHMSRRARESVYIPLRLHRVGPPGANAWRSERAPAPTLDSNAGSVERRVQLRQTVLEHRAPRPVPAKARGREESSEALCEKPARPRSTNWWPRVGSVQFLHNPHGPGPDPDKGQDWSS